MINIIGLSTILKKRENFDEIREESIRLFRGQNHTSFRSTAYSKSTIASAGLKSSSRIRYSSQPDIGILATEIGKSTGSGLLKPEVELIERLFRGHFRSRESRNARNA